MAAAAGTPDEGIFREHEGRARRRQRALVRPRRARCPVATALGVKTSKDAVRAAILPPEGCGQLPTIPLAPVVVGCVPGCRCALAVRCVSCNAGVRVLLKFCNGSCSVYDFMKIMLKPYA